jgi:hypothetical protein
VAQLPGQIKDTPPVLQTLLLGLPIVAYVAKDRIKELTREWLSRRLQSFDHSSEIRAGSLAEAGLDNFSGRVQERVSFKSSDALPADVLALRMSNRTVQGADAISEEILSYVRRLEVHAADASPSDYGMALRQIIRLNLRHFLTRLDEPKQRESHYSAAEERFVDGHLPKVYHLNVIARVDVPGTPSTLHKWRVVLNKEGVVRLVAL